MFTDCKDIIYLLMYRFIYYYFMINWYLSQQRFTPSALPLITVQSFPSITKSMHSNSLNTGFSITESMTEIFTLDLEGFRQAYTLITGSWILLNPCYWTADTIITFLESKNKHLEQSSSRLCHSFTVFCASIQTNYCNWIPS